MRQAILSYLNRCEDEMFNLLERLVLQESYTLNKEGVDAVGRIIQAELLECGMTLDKEERDDLGDHLVFHSAGYVTSTVEPILLVGHMDTVFPPEMKFNWYGEDETKAYGPGVVDMKGGLVAAIFAIKALSHVGLLDKIPITLICNSDEEKGSLTSKDLLRREANRSLLALVFECGGSNGEMVTGRKGKLGFHIKVEGQAGHAAFPGKFKASAVLELAHKIIAIEKLNNPEKGLIVNVGLINGGIGANTVAEKAEAHVDCRYLTDEDGQYCIVQLHKIIIKQKVPRTGTTWSIPITRAIMSATDQNRKLLSLFNELAGTLNQSIGEEMRSGVSDANTLAGCGIPVLDGLGPIGGNDHSNREYMIKESLCARTKLAAIALEEIYYRQKTASLFT